jgi:hypothetical protein
VKKIGTDLKAHLDCRFNLPASAISGRNDPENSRTMSGPYFQTAESGVHIETEPEIITERKLVRLAKRGLNIIEGWVREIVGAHGEFSS